ncbi:MAG: hypothetical protein U9Q81_07905 [Pseudomonadota bacterium]|nr:hypothetical protein [Pseudomonadota bacterium]
MAGIAGIIRATPYPGIDRDASLMVDAMRHEEGCAVGEFRDPHYGIRLGWTGYPPSVGDWSPVVTRTTGALIVVHGEHFGNGTRSAVASEAWDGRGASQKLRELYEADSSYFVSRLNGWFAGVIIDFARGTVLLFNDRYGMGRLYLHCGRDEFLFASEAKSLLRVRPQLRAINSGSLAELLRYNCVLNDSTLFAGVSLLPRASAWEFKAGGNLDRRKYFSFQEWEEQSSLSPATFHQAYTDTVSRVFPTYAREQGDVGISLTAGLDTRQIMAALGEACKDHPCFTFDGTFGELFDSRTARKLAAVHQSPFEIIRIDERFLKHFGEYARRAIYLSDGTHDAFGAHDVFFNEIARRIAPVRLTGKFGSEVVRIRNIVPSYIYPSGFLLPEIGELVRRLPPFPELKRGLHPLTAVVGWEIPWHEYGRLKVEQSQLVMRTPYMDNELVKLMYSAPADARARGSLQERYVSERSPEFGAFMSNLGRFASVGGMARNNPVLTQLASGALRALFKVEYIYLYGTPHWLTAVDRRLSRWHLERWLSGRQKWEGYRIWMTDRFSGFLRETLLSTNARFGDFFVEKRVKTMLMQHLAGTHNHITEINKVLTVELICSTLLKEGAFDHRAGARDGISGAPQDVF